MTVSLDLSASGGPARQVGLAVAPLVRAAATSAALEVVSGKSVDRPLSLPAANGTTTVHLTPATLGAVTVSITRDADGVTVAIAAARPETLVSLAADRHALQAALTEVTGGAAHVRVTLSAFPQPDDRSASATQGSFTPQLSTETQTSFGANGQHRPATDAGRAPSARQDTLDMPIPVAATAIVARGVVDITA